MMRCKNVCPAKGIEYRARQPYAAAMQNVAAFKPPPRLLMGPGPSNVAPSVLRAMSQPLVGHLDPTFIHLMEEVKSMLRTVFQTRNDVTFPVSGTGSAGMEFCFVNLVQPAD